MAAQAALEQNRDPGNLLTRAEAFAQVALENNPSSSDAWQTPAEVHRLKAAALQRQGSPTRNEVARGLDDAARALELNPASWQAMITSAGLHLLREPKRTAEACALLDAAVRTNPLAEHDAAPLQRQCGGH